MVKDSKNLVVGLDVGTSKIVAIVAEIGPEGELNVIGLGTQPSRGLKRGVVVNIEATMASIQRVLEEAELMADCRIGRVTTGIAGSHIRSLNSSGMVAIKEGEVQQADIDRVIETAKAIAIPNDQQILHILPQEFIIDGQDDVREPLGMSGVRLEAKVHIVTAAVTSAQNIVKCANKAGLNVIDIVLEPLASAEASLAEDERDLGPSTYKQLVHHADGFAAWLLAHAVPSVIWPVPTKAPAAIKNGMAGTGSPICSANTVAASTAAPCCVRNSIVSFISNSAQNIRLTFAVRPTLTTTPS